MNKRINVVTGCAGFLGSRLVEMLNAREEFVIGYDNLYRGYEGVRNLEEIKHPDFHFICGDILDFQKLKSVIAMPDVERVFHLAAYPSHRLALERPHDYMSVDLQGTANVLEAARLAGKPMVVFASSNKVYGKQECPWREDKLPQPEGPYAMAKYAAEKMCEMYTKYFEVPTLVLRYHHVAGKRSNPELALSIFVEQAIKGEVLQVHGKQTDQGWESCSANYTHVDDAITATLAAADNYRGFDVFNVANSKTIPVEYMARWVVKRLNSKSNIDLVGMLPHETLVHASDVSKIRDRLGFNAQKTPEDAFSDYTEWRLSYD